MSFPLTLDEVDHNINMASESQHVYLSCKIAASQSSVGTPTYTNTDQRWKYIIIPSRSTEKERIQLAYTFSSFFDTFFTPSVTVLLATPLVLLYGPHVLTTLSLASSSVRTGKFA